MVYFTFAIFFAFNFSLWFMLPALLLRNITKPGKKKKDKNIKHDYVIYTALSVLYGLSFLMFYNAFDTAIKESVSSSTMVNYFMDNIGNLTFVMILFLITSIVHGLFTFNLSRKLFRFEKINYGYVIISITGLLNIITYFISNSVLELNLYAFEAKQTVLNFLLKTDYQLLLFLFPILVFGTFALSFIEEE